MRNIIKTQFFQIKKDKLIKYMVVITLISQILMVALPLLLETEAVISGGEFYATSGNFGSTFAIFFLILVTAEICGADFLDKNNHYEIMGGHKRYEVFMGRVIPSLLIGGLGAFFFTLLPIGIYTACNGWGTKLDFGMAILRWLLLLFPLFRLVCEMACLTFLLKNPYVVMGIGYLIFMSTFVTTGMIEARCVFLGVTNIAWIQTIGKWMTYGLGADVNYIFDASMSFEMVLKTIVISVVVGVATLFAGVLFFKEEDMN